MTPIPHPAAETQGPERPPHWPLPSFDAQDWAKEFMRLFGDRRQDIDESLMLGWFANALMRGWDEHQRRYPTGEPL